MNAPTPEPWTPTPKERVPEASKKHLRAWIKEARKAPQNKILVEASALIVADDLLAEMAAHVREVAERTWDEGYEHAGHEQFDGVYDGNPTTSPNPYRAGEEQ